MVSSSSLCAFRQEPLKSRTSVIPVDARSSLSLFRAGTCCRLSPEERPFPFRRRSCQHSVAGLAVAPPFQLLLAAYVLCARDDLLLLLLNFLDNGACDKIGGRAANTNQQ